MGNEGMCVCARGAYEEKEYEKALVNIIFKQYL